MGNLGEGGAPHPPVTRHVRSRALPIVIRVVVGRAGVSPAAQDVVSFQRDRVVQHGGSPRRPALPIVIRVCVEKPGVPRDIDASINPLPVKKRARPSSIRATHPFLALSVMYFDPREAIRLKEVEFR